MISLFSACACDLHLLAITSYSTLQAEEFCSCWISEGGCVVQSEIQSDPEKRIKQIFWVLIWELFLDPFCSPDPRAGVPAPAQSRAADTEGHACQQSSPSQGIGAGSRLLQPLHTVISFTSLASLGSFASHCDPYIPLHSLNPLQPPCVPCILKSLLQPFQHPLNPLHPLHPSQFTESLMPCCIFCVSCSLLCHLHPVHPLHSSLAACGACTQLPAKPHT